MKNKVQTIIPENIESEANIPQQIIPIVDFKVKIKKFIKGGRIALTQNTYANMGIGFLIQMIWIQL